MMHLARAALGVALLFWVSALPVTAQDVELRSLDGTVELEGNLIAFDGAFYRLETVYGPITVSAEGVSCAGPGCPDLTSFIAEARVAGATTVAEDLLPALLRGFADARGMTAVEHAGAGGLRYDLQRQDGTTAARFHVTPGSTDDGFRALLTGGADMALALRLPTPGEIDAADGAAPDDPALTARVRVLALDALVPVVSSRNPLDSISMAELGGLFSGEIDNWLDLGGPDAPVALHLLAPGFGLSQAFETRVLLPAAADLAPDIQRHDSAAALAAAVARDPYAIGITAQSALGAARALALAGPCGFAQAATRNAVKAEDYPLTAPVFVYLAPRRLPQLVRDFLRFTETDTAERIVAQAGYVNQSLTRTALDFQGRRLANAIAAAGGDLDLEDLQRLVAQIDGTERLSTTFRFAGGSSDLDPQSQAAVSRLVAAIERGAFDGRRLIFAGFSDSAGPAAVNLRLSARRATAVRDAVRSALADSERVEMVAEGFGEAMPMACDEADWGGFVNRRVEVWLD